ncbi:MAG: zinc metalloprotease HtpX [Dehalococcoidia bacterium]|nr:zinc metalloprotease HtpX [Dehalococcoidia bacterium]MDW8120445.1 zinc metalloprotease HtpX [Chloroflexota bacterium]
MAVRARRIPRDWGLLWRMAFVMALLAGLYLAFITFLTAAGVPWLMIAIIAGIMLGLQYFLSDKMVLWSLGAKVVSPQDAPKLHAMVERLALQAGLPKPKIAIIDTDIPNALATGRNPKNAVVAVTTGIMRRLDDEELEAVLGHELAHIKNRDVLVITLASFFSMVASMLTNWLMWVMLFGGFGRRDERGGGAGAIMLVWLVSLLVYIISQLLILALSRYREYAADYAGAILTGMPSRLASALMKISGAIARIPTEDLRKVEGANAFFIVSALKGEVILELLSTHPPVHKRVERLRRLEQRLEWSR